MQADRRPPDTVVRYRPSLLERIRHRFRRRVDRPQRIDPDRLTSTSPGGSREFEEVMVSPPVDTPGRRAPFERVTRRTQSREAQEPMELPWFIEGVTVLTPEGSAEVLEEIRNGSPDTPERRAMFARMQRRAEIRKRLAAEEAAARRD